MWYFITVILRGGGEYIFTVGDKAAEAEAVYSGMQKCKIEGKSASINGIANNIGVTIDMNEVVLFRLFSGAK